MKTHDLSKYRNVTSDVVAKFLMGQGWQEINRKDGIVAVWGITKKEDIYKVLLPLNSELPDYPNKMIQVLETVGIVELRKESDLLESFLDTSILSREVNRELLDLRLLPDLENGAAHEFPAKKLGFILTSLQNLIDSIGQAEEGLCSSITTGAISKAITDRTRLSVIGTAPGSFIVKLAGVIPPEQIDWLEQLNGSLNQRALNSFINLISISHEGRMDDLKELLIRLQRRTVVSYRKFLWHISSANSGLDIRLGSTNPSIGGKAHLNSTEILGLIDFLNRVEPQTPEVIKVDGTLKLFGEKGKEKNVTFIIERLQDEKIFSGKIASSVLKKGVPLTHNKDYRAIIEETESVNSVTNESSKNWTLVDIDYLENALNSDSEDVSEVCDEE